MASIVARKTLGCRSRSHRGARILGGGDEIGDGLAEDPFGEFLLDGVITHDQPHLALPDVT